MINIKNVIENTEWLERVIQAVGDPKLIRNIDVTGQKLRLTFCDIRYNIYHSGYVSVVERGIESTDTPEARLLERILGLSD